MFKKKKRHLTSSFEFKTHHEHTKLGKIKKRAVKERERERIVCVCAYVC